MGRRQFGLNAIEVLRRGGVHCYGRKQQRVSAGAVRQCDSDASGRTAAFVGGLLRLILFRLAGTMIHGARAHRHHLVMGHGRCRDGRLHAERRQGHGDADQQREEEANVHNSAMGCERRLGNAGTLPRAAR